MGILGLSVTVPFVVNKFSLDPTWRRPKNGDVLIAGSPLRIFRLSSDGVRVAEQLEREHTVSSNGSTLVTRLIDAGALHPLPDSTSSNVGPQLSDITVVIPAYVRSQSEHARVVELAASFPRCAAVVVVDDASPFPVGDLDNSHVTVVRLSKNSGPGAARNAGLELAHTSHVAFIDADVSCTETDVEQLSTWWLLPQLGLLAPRVRSRDWFNYGKTIAAYEAIDSPLDMGEVPARVRMGTKVSYVPSAMLLCSVTALNAVGGFNAALRVGEDVDLVWRLDTAGFPCRYEPAVEVHHQPRATLSEFVKQRYDYGLSAATLAELHPGALAPVRVSWWSVSVWGSLVAGLPLLGGVVALGTAAALTRKVRFLPDAAFESVRLAGLGHFFAGKQIAKGITRTWWPIALFIALFSRRARWVLLAAATLPALGDWWKKRPQLDPVRFTMLRLLDDTAYGAGVWRGVLRSNHYDALKPDLTSWPTNSRPPAT